MSIRFTEDVLDLTKYYGLEYPVDTWDPQSKEKRMAERLASAACNGKVSDVAKLLQAKANVNYSEHPSNQTPLLLAAAWGHDTICKMLLEARADPHVRHETYHDSPLDYAQRRAGLVVASKKDSPVFLTATPEQRERYKRIVAMLLHRPHEKSFL